MTVFRTVTIREALLDLVEIVRAAEDVRDSQRRATTAPERARRG